MTEPTPGPERWPPHLVTVSAILVAASRFVPVPLVDDLLAGQVRRFMVVRLLRDAGRTFDPGRVKPLWEDSSGCGGCLMSLLTLPLKVILFPIRKIVALVGAVTGMSRDLTDTLLLARAVDRALRRGLMPEGAEPATLTAEATAVRAAYQTASKGTDLALLRSVVTDALQGARGLAGAALRAARRLVSRAPDDAPADTGSAEVERGARQVEDALQRPEVVKALQAFDARLDAALPGGPAASAST